MAAILLDTDNISELMRAKPAPAVLDWFAHQHETAFFICSVIRAEILLGVALLPAGKRRDALATASERMFAEDFSGRSLSFDNACAMEYAVCVTTRNRSGRSISTEDGQIAAIAVIHGLTLATRNGKDFTRIGGLVVVDP